MPPVLIAGAGPTGLVLALWLTRRGIPVRIIDKAAEPGTTSRALAVQVRTLELYRQLGIVDALLAEGVRIPALNFWARGERAARVPLEEIGEGLTPYPFIFVHPQDKHERLLIRELEALGVNVERRVELTHLEQSEAAVRATLRRADGAEEVCETAWLAGCDGAGSVVRHQLGIGFPGGTYTGRFYVADVEATGPAANGELHVDFEEADFALVFPMKGDGRVRLVGLVRGPAVADQRQLTFEDVRGRAVENLRLDVTKVNWFSTYNVHHRVAERFRDGRVFLLGDAAHVHSPVGGQGMNTGIGDAVNLAWKLAAVVKGESPAALLDSYEPERIAFARVLVATTDRAFTIVTQQGGLARFARTRAVPAVAPLLLRLRAVRRFMFRRVSQVGVHYRESALSEGHAGAVNAGDRLPWIETSSGADNFAPLTSLNWQAHVYGTAQPALTAACADLPLPLHVFAWNDHMARAGFAQDALYLVRPDGYVALADPEGRADALREYVDRRGLTGTAAPRVV
ncbi:MAG: FAD-dependent monooxygenase [Acidobacteriota bacterium]|nr:FAD-dependent monooxygenase [Acidobacteriota bacterium]